MYNKIKHLEMLQAIISRMSSNSLDVKGWSVTVSMSLLVLVLANDIKGGIVVTITILILFWLVDSYYLAVERAFRELFQLVIDGKVGEYRFAPGRIQVLFVLRAAASIPSIVLYLGGIFVCVVAGLMQK
ncbi:MAG: hypothetical protein AAGI52_05850 [Bacteroidota bacterium]